MEAMLAEGLARTRSASALLRLTGHHAMIGGEVELVEPSYCASFGGGRNNG